MGLNATLGANHFNKLKRTVLNVNCTTDSESWRGDLARSFSAQKVAAFVGFDGGYFLLTLYLMSNQSAVR